MNSDTHSQLANFIWGICNLLRGPYKRNEYRKVILSLTVLRRFDCLVLSHVSDAWIDESKIKIGYEIPFSRHFYRYEPPRPLEAIEQDIKGLEEETVVLLKEVTV
jgi:type I restriction-modification system DNA methylase subunit